MAPACPDCGADLRSFEPHTRYCKNNQFSKHELSFAGAGADTLEDNRSLPDPCPVCGARWSCAHEAAGAGEADLRAESVASGILCDLGNVPVTDDTVAWVAQRIEAYAARPVGGEAERLGTAADYDRIALVIATAKAEARNEFQQALAEKDAEIAELMRTLECVLTEQPLNGEYVHLLTCSGSRQHPPGTHGVSCSCGVGRASRAALGRVQALIETWERRADWAASDSCPRDFYPQDAFTECATRLRAALRGEGAATPPQENQ